ncbi:MAG TPA: hypothetical protein DEB39_08430 [Planctomycetaceae bacterium]|nr:hypothetical protein [Planctomycetaceae bacterium]
MPKALCIFSLSVSGLLFLLYFLDLISGFPFAQADGILIDILYMVCSALVGAFSYLTLRELR